MGLAFAVQVLLAQLLGVAAFGEYTYILSWMMLLSLVARLGFDSAGIRFLASYSSTSDWQHLRGFLVKSHSFVLGVSLLIGAIGAGIVAALRDTISQTIASAGLIACVALPVFTVLHLQSSLLRGLKRITTSLTPTELLRPAVLGAALIVWGQFDDSPIEAPRAMLAHLGAILLALFVTTRALQRHLPPEVRRVPSRFESGQWLLVAFPLLLISGFQILLSQTDVLMVGALLGTDRAGIYSAASRLAHLIPFGLIAVNAIVAPMIAELWAQNEQAKLQRLLTGAARTVCILTMALALGLALVAKFALGLFGPEFTLAHPALLILIVGQLAVALSGSVGFVMTMTGLERQAAVTAGVIALVNLMLNALLIPMMGLQGAATATACSIALWNAAMLIIVARARRLNASIFNWRGRP